MHHTSMKTIGYVTDVIEIHIEKIQPSPMTSKRSHHLIKLLMFIAFSFNRAPAYEDIIGLKCNSSYG